MVTSGAVVGGTAISLRSAQGSSCFGGEASNWADRFSLIAFNDNVLKYACGDKIHVRRLTLLK
ncbi:MAG: hypothetical protein V1913_05345 [Fibrobacterota bacterium]